MLPLLFCLSVGFIRLITSKPNYCLPSNTTCWPTTTEIEQLESLLNGELVQPSDGNEYNQYVNMTQDLLYRNQYPSFFVIVKSVKDIQNSVLFASLHNIEISILSTGHSWAGISTANNSLQINLSKMTAFSISADNNSITVETGLTWGPIYAIVNSVNRIIVGCADPSVGPGGYALGGGHSALTPYFGLSADFITELYMVDANANILHIYNTSGKNETIDSLFWASRGGGGGSFGVVINITFALHKPVETYVYTDIYCDYSFFEYRNQRKHFILDIILNNLWELIQTETLDPKWGGYLVMFEDKLLITNFTFYGNADYARQNAQPLLTLNMPYNNSNNMECEFIEYQTYEEYAIHIPPNTGGSYEIQFNNLITAKNLTQNFTNLIIDFLNSSNLIENGFLRVITSILVGGNMHNFSDDYNSNNPAWRHSALLFVPALAWSNSKYTDNAIQHVNYWEPKFQPYGGGVYNNEQNYNCAGCDWKELYWGSEHYQRLLSIKQQCDPNQVFWCHHCIGDDSS